MSAVYVRYNDTNVITYNPSSDGCSLNTNSSNEDSKVLSCGAPKSATLKFTGTAVFYLAPSIVMQYSPMLLTLDNNAPTLVSPPNNTAGEGYVLSATNLENNEHTLKVEPAFEGGSFYVDTVVYIAESPTDGFSTTATSTTTLTASTTVTPSSSSSLETSAQSTLTSTLSSKTLASSTLTSESSVNSESNVSFPANISSSSHHNGVMIGLGVVAGILALILLGILIFWLRRRQARRREWKLRDNEARAVIDPLPPPPPAGGYVDSLLSFTPLTVINTVPSTPYTGWEDRIDYSSTSTWSYSFAFLQCYSLE
ncbi:hypothetical protein BDQ17DRAFT_1408257 [Cyathus striatus]|nr:hypothetical protein BDQ17DRAFT_1408257 [Cyathus striatus]